MQLSNLLRCAHFPVAAGLAPHIDALDANVNNRTYDWKSKDKDKEKSAESVDEEDVEAEAADRLLVSEPGPAEDPRVPAEDPRVQAVVAELWGVFQKSEDSSVSREEYAGFTTRVLRVLIPGLSAEQEEVVVASTWRQDAGGVDRLTFAPFFNAIVGFACDWTDSDNPVVVEAFLQDIMLRTTRVKVTAAATGKVQLKEHIVQVKFRGEKVDAVSTRFASDRELTKSLEVRQKGMLPAFQLQLGLNNTASLSAEVCCWWEEAVRDPVAETGVTDGAQRVWAPVEQVLPMGHVMTRLVMGMEDHLKAESGCVVMDFDVSAVAPGASSPHAGAAVALGGLLSPDGAAVAESSAVGQAPVLAGTQERFGLRELLAAALQGSKDVPPMPNMSILLSPVKAGGVLDKLAAVRKGLLLPEVSVWTAALKGQDLKDPIPDLPTFPAALNNQLVLDKEAEIVRPVYHESLLACAGVSDFAKAFVCMRSEMPARPTSRMSIPASSKRPSRRLDTPVVRTDPFTAHVPPQAESLNNDSTDLLRVAHTSPMALWVLGQCDAAGDYKTEVCRHFAEKLGLQWLKPTHLLELAVKTPLNRRTPLMARCVEQLQRGMSVSVADALNLSLEMMTSARCKTNGYVLDFPPVRPEDAEDVAAFVERVRELSGAETVDWEGFLKDEVQLPPLKPEPEPPEPPPEEPEGGEGEEGGEEAAEEGDEAGEGGEEGETAGAEREEDPGAQAAATSPEGSQELVANAEAADGEPADGEGEEGEEGDQEGEDADVEPPPPPKMVPNPLANAMPRRLIVLSAESDELAAWRLTLLKLRHEEKERRRKELEEAGEEPEEEEEEEADPEEKPALPEEEEEREELFEKNAGDVLITMAEFVPPAPLEQPKALPPIPDSSEDPQPEPADSAALKEGETATVDLVHREHEVPLLALHADGRPPKEMAELLEVTTGKLRCPRVPLPRPLDGESADEPKDLLRLDLEDKQVSRRWSQWKQHCPVALYDKKLVPGNKDFSADYAGYAFCFSTAAAQRRFCVWPKLFLTDAPRINAPGMHLGYLLLSPMGFRVPELASRLSARYGFDFIDVVSMIQQAMANPTIDFEETGEEPAASPAPAETTDEEGADDEEGAEDQEEQEEQIEPEPTGPRLFIAEKQAFLAGTPLSNDTLVRLVAEALGVARNIEILQKQRDDIAEAKKILEEFAAKEAEGGGGEEGEEPEQAPEYDMDEEGNPVVPLSEPLLVPERGFVLTGFPESVEQLEALKGKLALELERVLLVKPMAEEEPKEPAEILAEQGFRQTEEVENILTMYCPPLEAQEGEEEPAENEGEEGANQNAPMERILASQAANFEALTGVEELQMADVAMEATEEEMFLQIQKHIDPFFEIVDGEGVADEIPDPDEWEQPEAEEPEEGEPPPDPLELPTRPVIPWGVCGPFCPVTLKEDDWLFPGQKSFQHMYNNKVYALASEEASAKFVAEPSKYVPGDREPTVPRTRILVTGPTGSKVDKHCELLSEAYKIPVVKIESEWKAEVAKRLKAARAAVRKAAAEAEAAARALEEAEREAEERAAREAAGESLDDEGQEGDAEQNPQDAEQGDVEGQEEAEEQEPKVDGVDDEGQEGDAAQEAEEQEPKVDGVDDEGREGDAEQQPEGQEGAEQEPEEEEPDNEEDDDGLDDEGREALFVAAMRHVLGAHCGACILDGSFFGDLANEEMDDAVREARSLQSLLMKAQRIPDVVFILKCKNELAAANALNLEEIDREYEERKAAYEKLVAEAEENEEDPPEPPEGLVLDADEDEKESDRVKASFIEKKGAEQQALKDLADALKEARGVVHKVSIDRGDEPAQKALKWRCRPYVENRASLFILSQMAKVAPSRSADLAQRALALPARFGEAPPLFLDAPIFPGKPDAFRYAIEYRRRLYFPRGPAEQDQFLERPVDFIHQPFPSRVIVNPAAVVSGPPLAGKTFFAKALAERTGAVYLSLPEVIDRLCNRSAMPCWLSRSITEHLRAGRSMPDDLLTAALQHRLAAPDVLSRGWVMDDFPLTMSQAKALTAAGIVPHRVLMVNAPEGLIFGRARELAAAGSQMDPDLVQQEGALQRKRLQAYQRNSPLLRAYYSFKYDNVRDIDGSRSTWSVSDHALQETSAAISQRLEYYRKTASGMAARIYGMGFTAQRLQEAESDFKHYCPVTLTLTNELMPCSDPRCVVEYKSKVYWLSSEEHTRSFLDDPDSYLQVPLPQAVPRLMSPMERRMFASAVELEGHCPVALVDGQELVKASGNHAVEYQRRYWTFECKDACEKFMRRPARYAAKAKLPSKRPETQNEDTKMLLKVLTEGRNSGREIDQSKMLTYMQASISEIICHAMVELGARRPLYPGKSPQESSLLFLARYVKAKNSVTTELYAADVRKMYEDFLHDCSVPQQLRDLMEQEKAGAKDWTAWDKQKYKELNTYFDDLFADVDTSARN